MILTDYVKESDSQKRKNAAYYDAVKHLTDDIQEFKRGIDNINPVDFPK